MNRVPEIISAAGFSPPKQFNYPENFLNFSPLWAFYLGEEIKDPRSRVGDKAVYLEIGAGVRHKGKDTLEIKAAHTLLEGRKTFRPPDFPRGWDIYRSESMWTKRVDGRLDNTRLLTTCDQVGEQFLNELPKALGALTDRILMISEHIAKGDTWDRYLTKLPAQPTTEPFIQFSWHSSRKRRRKD